MRKKYNITVQKSFAALGERWRIVLNKWHIYDKRWGRAWRVANGALAVLIILGVAAPVMQDLWQKNRYELSAATADLVGKTNSSLSDKLTYDAMKQEYQYNKDALAQTPNPSNPAAALMKAQAGTASKKSDSLYALDLPQDLSKGVTYHDTNTELSFSLVPQFSSLQGKEVQGHLVYPLDGNAQAIYTLKNNGLKEDIVVPQATSDTMQFSYKLNLPDTLQAKVIPDSGGAIGIYSADPSLFGQISYGTSADEAKVMKARQNSPKDNLVFGLPAPVIKNAKGVVESANARFQLSNKTLTVVADNLSGIKGPITIDPSVTVTSSSDFSTGNDEDNIDFSTSGQINRGGMTGGRTGFWASATSLPSPDARANFPTIAYNGYLYILGGGGSAYFNDVWFNSINSSNGSLGGSWTQTTSFTNGRFTNTAVAYNGYMYVMGGRDATNYYNDVQYAPINSSDGTLGSWQYTYNSTSSSTQVGGAGFTTARWRQSSVVYNNYLYIMGGMNSAGGYLSDIQYAPINANGTVGTWTTSATGLPSNRMAFAATINNNYLYIMGGSDGTTNYNTVNYIKINADGTLDSSWQSATNFTTGRFSLAGMAYGGYMYILGGYSGANQADVQYAPINANGSLGAWTTSTSLTSGRYGNATAAYNGYLYTVGGFDGTNNLATAQYVNVIPAGTTQSFRNSVSNVPTLGTNRALACSVAYNGNLYVIGGSTNDTGNNNSRIAQYATINADGTVGSWHVTSTSLSVGRGSSGCTAYNGKIYLVGGYTGTTNNDGVVQINTLGAGGALGSWTTAATSLPSADQPVRAGVFIYGTSSGPYIYVIGGYKSNGSNSNGVTYAPLTSAGDVGSWSAVSTMSQNYRYRATAMVGNFIYAYGGLINSGSTLESAAEYTSINSDGTLNSWQATSSPMPTAIGFTNGTSINGCIYSLGGEDAGGTSQQTAQYGCPDSTGDIPAANWHVAPDLVVGTTDMAVTSYNGYIYGIGGATTTQVGTTEFSSANNGGSGAAGSWTTSGNQLNTKRGFLSSTVYNGYLYAFGGVSDYNNTTYYKTVEYAQLGTNGSIGSWTSENIIVPAVSSTNPVGYVGAGLVAYDGYMYVVGGYNSIHTNPNYSVFDTINSDGSLSGTAGNSTWTSTAGLNHPRDTGGFAQYNGYIYYIGGNDGSDESYVEHSQINTSTGQLGTWVNDTANPLPSVDYGGTAAAYNGYLYVMGGDNGSTIMNNVWYAPLNASTGSVGAWTSTASFNTPRAIASSFVYNGFLYIGGGTSDTNNVSTAFSDVQYAPISANGSLGAWQTTTSFGTARSGFAMAEYNGYAYVWAGYGASGPKLGDVQYAPLSSISRVAHYSKLIDLGVSATLQSITYDGTLPNGVNAISYRAAPNGTTVFGSLTAASSLSGGGGGGGGGTCGGGGSGTRWVWVSITMDDSGDATFPDAAGSIANVTDFTINYQANTGHPAPNIRLRAGQTLQTGTLSPLDTCGP